MSKKDQPEPPAHPGLVLLRARIRAGVGLRQAARAAGCSHTLLSLIECGKRRICLRQGRMDLEGLAKLLGLSDREREALGAAEARR